MHQRLGTYASMAVSREVNDMRSLKGLIFGAVLAGLVIAVCWQLLRAKEVMLLPQKRLSVCEADAVTLSPSGKRVAVTCARDNVYVYQLPALKQLARLKAKEGRSFQAAFAPNKNLLAVAEWAGGVTLWDTETWSKVREIHTDGRANAVRFSPDGAWLAATIGAGGWCLVVWKTDQYQKVYRFKAQGSSMFGSGFSCVDFLNNQTLVAGGLDGCVYIWNLNEGRLLNRLCGHSQPIWRIAALQLGRLIASSSLDNTVVIWDWQNSRKVATMKGLVVASSPKRGLFAVSSATRPTMLQLKKVQGWQTVFSEKVRNQNVLDMVFSPDGNHLVTVGNGQTIIVWRVPSP